MGTPTSIYSLTKPTVAGDAGIWPGALNTDLDSLDDLIARPKIVFNSPTVGATTTCDLSLARVFAFTVSQATTLAFTNVPSSSFAVSIRLLITNGSAFVLTWPASITWLSGSPPVLHSSGVDIVELVTKDGGTTWYGGLAAPSVARAPGVLYQNTARVSTTSGVDVSLASYTLPAGLLSVNGQRIRITVAGACVPAAAGATVNIKFGAAALGAFALGANDVFFATFLVERLGATNQWYNLGYMKGVAPLAGTNSGNPTETLANTVLIDFRGNVTTGGQTLTYDSLQVEFLAA